MTVLLALDTATEACSAALAVGGEVLGRFEICPQQHTQKILPMVDSLLAEAGLTLKAVDALVFGRGPGSFTGVRIGIGIAQGLAFSADKPLVGVSNLAAMAQQALTQEGAKRVLAAIDARMGEVYVGAFEEAGGLMQLVGEEAVLPPEAVTSPWPGLAVGTGFEAYPELAHRLALQMGKVTLPDARFMLPLAARAYTEGSYTDALHVEPVYLRDKVTWKKLPGRE
ncbi:tRNA (adenosine(37)-N6)-threonylcarbamoyltransferase complex dimerization subunit type 1 TsaB [Gallaecimonas kandeliae]|uniref:tRNA (adenosine(37)-N6)-threonylcarbamoyltransferase complex dimerization subunit type 1 TsaB n=1 Tax=Gallaecimonas kandeliae TaxID=3029055 RepID=UPI002647BFA5|nr:tRNA (adenosine(37)-N6)-threonylcarbamoyltransferase complex dimerization subunit type 1 TsaB [Gallaecimonas kandeliae]WKE64413.1 tRNA (adenosine(37)-N6)-threonylcarbamoyltransferase complex dimerization subunit type 1 TsaB [Gallaecimonas kandeliae]